MPKTKKIKEENKKKIKKAVNGIAQEQIYKGDLVIDDFDPTKRLEVKTENKKVKFEVGDRVVIKKGLATYLPDGEVLTVKKVKSNHCFLEDRNGLCEPINNAHISIVEKVQLSLPDSEQGVKDYHKWNKYGKADWTHFYVLSIGFLLGFVTAIILFNSAIVSFIS